MSIESRLQKIEKEIDSDKEREACVCVPSTYAIEGNGGKFADVPPDRPANIARMVGGPVCDVCGNCVQTIIRVVYNEEDTGGEIPVQDYTEEDFKELKETGILLPKI